MSESNASPVERRSATRELIDRMLRERQRMLVLYERVAGIEPYSDDPPSAELLREFANILVDYIAAGHFGVYARIEDGSERRRRVVDLARELFPRISATTEAALAFNDAIDQSRGDGLSYKLARMLPALGEQIATRIELEDRLIGQLLAR